MLVVIDFISAVSFLFFSFSYRNNHILNVFLQDYHFPDDVIAAVVVVVVVVVVVTPVFIMPIEQEGVCFVCIM